jgi:hypothetical protein
VLWVRLARRSAILAHVAEREIVEEVPLCTPDGRLNPDAMGWSRRPIHRCALRGNWLRRKRWDYWALTTDRHLLFLLLADVDYLGLAVVSLLDLATGRRFEAAAATPLGIGVRLPDTVGGAPVRFDHLGVRVVMDSGLSRVALGASARALSGDRLEVDVLVEPPPGRDTLSVAVPLTGGRFQFTSKEVGMPASDRVLWNGAPLDFSRAWACLDFGRGIWPYRTAWCWAAASGLAAGRNVSLNLGGLWTDATGVTENGFWIGDRLHKLGEDLAFRREPPGWLIRSPTPGMVDLRFTPLRHREVGLDLGLLRARLDWSIGHFSGRVRGDGGMEVAVDGILGWFEELDARW